MASWWTFGLLLAFVSTSLAGTFLTCKSDQTEVKTGYIYDNTKKYADCPELVGSYIDWYQKEYRAECQRWMGGSEPERVGNAYISECHKYSNGTFRYRADVCCEGVVQAMRCFTCQNATDHYSCDYRGTVETCATGEVCSTVFNYYGSNGQYCPRKITKGCMAPQTCNAMVAENTNLCKRYVDKPRCAYCHDETLGNWVTSVYNTYQYCGTNPCASRPCGNGRCFVNSTLTLGYYCQCYPYSWANSVGRCSETICGSRRPCQNNAICSQRSSPTPYYRCCCRQGWTGYNCSQAVTTGCANSPGYCMNGGTCYDYGTKGLRCRCPTGWVGERCENSNEVTCKAGTTGLFTLSSYYSNWRPRRNCSNFKYYHNIMLSRCFSWMRRPGGPYFKNGVHGLVTKTEYNGLKSCVPGEKCFWFTAQACCPTCLSAPCLNGGWCVQKENHDYVCKCRFGFEGKYCENKVAICVASGDPHYDTFDGEMMHFQGNCTYNMATPSRVSPGLTHFQVLTKNEHRNGNTDVSYPRYFEILVFGYTIRLDKNKKAYVDTVEVFPDVSYPGFKITLNGNYLRLETNFSLVVEYDGDWIGIVKVPQEYRELMGGLCANFDGDASNDFVTSDGTDVSDSPTRYSDFGNSWQVGDPNCPKITINDSVCDLELEHEVGTNDYCGYIMDTSGPFSACVASDRKMAEMYFENCVYDTCAEFDTETSCKSMAAFVSACTNKGYGPPKTWRETVGCPRDCPTGMTYHALASACHATCAIPLAETECGLPDTESCKCSNGTVLHQGKCQNPSVCGCLSLECPKGQTCKIVNGQAGCHTDIPPANWGSWGAWGDCSLPYGQGKQRRYRKCNNPAPSRGGQPCAGDRSQSRNCVCKTFYAAEDCKRCDETNNPAGYLPDPCSCDHYYQCFKSYGLWSRASLRECAPCTCWDQDKLTCVRDPSKDLDDCPVEPIVSEEVETDGDMCTRGANTYRIVRNSRSYEWLVQGTWTRMPCPRGTFFDAKECGCVTGTVEGAIAREEFCLTFDLGWDGFATSTGLYVQPDNVVRVKNGVIGYAGQFNGKNSKIEIPYFTNNEFSSFSFSLWFKRIGSLTGEQGLVYNGDCEEEGSIQIRSESYNAVGAGIWADDDIRTAFTGVTASGNSWNHLVLTYDGTQLKFYVNKVLVNVEAKTSGPTLSIHCPLVLGFKFAVNPQPGLYFSGLMDEVCFYKEAISQERVNGLFDVTRSATSKSATSD